MKIAITKKQNRNRLVCSRDDGTHTSSDLGPSLPYHDIAHYVVESKFGLRRGFFGHIALGFTSEQLGSKDVIKTLPMESWRAEVLARALGSLHTGACDPEQFSGLVAEELKRFNGHEALNLSPTIAREVLADYRVLLDRWSALRDGETLELTFAT